MSNLFGVGLDIEVKKINTLYKMQIAKRTGAGLKSLKSIFRKQDVFRNGAVTKE